ncbi:MAG TPA: FtsX-like permease family protein, partial [Gammaproteobacteria bacterium]|nr:FtsX-like permease family protein [Gammaproteobacteria bacterium]
TQLPEDWTNGGNTTFVLLPRDGSFTADGLRRQLPALVERHEPKAQRGRIGVTLGAVPVGSLLTMAVRDALFPRQSPVSVPLLLLLSGAIVLAVACINFANLATARAAARAREVGVRKAIGARPRQLIVQYLFEAGAVTAAAVAIALALLVLMTPVLEHAAGIDLRLLWSAEYVGRGVVSLLALGIAVTLAAGFYPAFVLSRLEPALAVRSGPTRAGPRSLAALLVGVQFALAAFLLIAVTIVHEQNIRLKHGEREMAADPLLVIHNQTEITGLRQDTLRQELLRLPQVRSATAMQVLPWSKVFTRMPLSSSPSAFAVQRSALLYVVGYDFFKTFDIPLRAGRVFDPKRADDVEVAHPNPTRAQNIVISIGLAQELGFKTPSAAVGRMIFIPTSLTGEARARPFRIIGVVENKSLAIASRYGSRPNVYLFNPVLRFHVVRLARQDVGGALNAIDTAWKRLVPSVSLDGRFLTDYFNERYASFARINQAFTALALIAWVISMIGLYAMAIMMSGRRIHEIAIRKTLGAHRAQMVRMLLKSFTAPVLMANVIAWPFGYLAGRAYLNVFVDPIPLTPWPFLVALLLSLLISWLAVGGQTWRAASAAPVQAMRHE